MNKKKIKVLHFIDSDGVYGAERVILNLSDELRKSSEFISVVGCIVSDLNQDNALYDAAIAKGIEAIKIPISNSKLIGDLPKAAKLLKQSEIDLIHSHGYKPSVYGFIIKLLSKVQIMATCHLWFEPKSGPLKMRFMIMLEKFFYRWYPLIVTVSEPIKRVLVQNNIPSDKVFVVENGVEITHDNALDSHQLKKELNIDNDTFVILNVGRLSKQKAQADLITAASHLKQFSEKFVLLIVGEGPLSCALNDQMKQLDLEQQVKLLGYREDIKALLSIADVFALPSLDEGMPMALLEAASASVPIVTTLVGDISKLIIDGETGIVIPFEKPELLADAIKKIWNNPEKAENIASAARKRMAERYSNQVMGEKYSKLYHYLLNHSKISPEL